MVALQLAQRAAPVAFRRLDLDDVGAVITQQPRAQRLRQRVGAELGCDRLRRGAIGGDFLRRFSVVFDLSHQRVYLDPNLQINHTAQEDMSGLSILAQGANLKTFEIVQVRQGTPGADAGLKEGDVIAGIDEEPAADITLTSIRELFRQVGHKYKLLIERNGKTQEVVIQMKRLI